MAKKAKPVIDFVTVNEIRYVMSNININEFGQIETSDISVKHLYADVMNGELCIDPIIQRLSGQWTTMMKSTFIISIINKRPCGTIIRAKGEATSVNYSMWTLLDGLQRITAICDFINDKYALSKNTQPVSCCFTNENNSNEKITETYNIAGKRFSQLPKVIQESILDYSILTYNYKGFTDAELDEIMFCANSGKAPTINQKLRYLLGSDNLRKLNPLFESTIWEEVKDCKEKNDTVLACILRILMLISQYDDCSLGSSTMNKFVKEFRNKVEDFHINKAIALVEQFAKVIESDMRDVELGYLNGCIIPHIIFNLDTFNTSKNPENKTYIEFLRYFWASDEYTTFMELSKAGGSGGAKYSSDNVCNRQKAMDDCLERFLDHIHNESAETVVNNHSVETIDDVDINDSNDTTDDFLDDDNDEIFGSDFDEDTFDENTDDEDIIAYDDTDISYDDTFDTENINNGECEDDEQGETNGAGGYSDGDNKVEYDIEVESPDSAAVPTDLRNSGQTDSTDGKEKSVTYLYTDRISTWTQTNQSR